MKYPSLSERLKNIYRHVCENRVKLLGTAGSWFLLDIVFYGHSLFSADVTHAMNTKDTLQDKTVTNLWIQLMAMPGYILSIIFIDKIGRKRLQIFGFSGKVVTNSLSHSLDCFLLISIYTHTYIRTGIAIIFLTMAMFLQPLKDLPSIFVMMYALTFFFDDFGPNTTTFS